jgi:uncharacterized protein
MAPMNTSDAPRLLTDAELARLDALLETLAPDDSMTLEELDGFLAALACCTERVPMDEYLPLVLGLDAGAAVPEGTELAELRRLLETHWLAVVGQLYEAQGFAPVLSYDEHGVAQGNAWAIGFLRGMAMRPDAWAPLEDDEEAQDILDPMMRLAEEVEPGEDGEPGEPIPDDERAGIIEAMFDSVMDINEFFREKRERRLAPPTQRRAGSKVGRNDPCPCGSGKKYKLCCGAGQPA